MEEGDEDGIGGNERRGYGNGEGRDVGIGEKGVVGGKAWAWEGG